VRHLANVSVETCNGGYTVKFAEKIGAEVLIRGVRNLKDLDEELTLAEENKQICPGIETIWIPCSSHLGHVSSSLVKNHIGADPDWEVHVARHVPEEVVLKIKEKIIEERAKVHWTSLMNQLGNPEGIEEVFEQIVFRYREPHRGYHTLLHIVNILDELASLNLKDITELKFALWFHDIIYDPRATDNESASESMAVDFARRFELKENFIDKVKGFIRVTRHTTMVYYFLEKLMVDLDLAILGKSEKEFDEYEAGIRKEYGWYSDEDYRKGRADFLSKLLARPSIYCTETFRAKYESTAQSNIARLIEKLS